MFSHLVAYLEPYRFSCLSSPRISLDRRARSSGSMIQDVGVQKHWEKEAKEQATVRYIRNGGILLNVLEAICMRRRRRPIRDTELIRRFRVLTDLTSGRHPVARIYRWNQDAVEISVVRACALSLSVCFFSVKKDTMLGNYVVFRQRPAIFQLFNDASLFLSLMNFWGNYFIQFCVVSVMRQLDVFGYMSWFADLYHKRKRERGENMLCVIRY